MNEQLKELQKEFLNVLMTNMGNRITPELAQGIHTQFTVLLNRGVLLTREKMGMEMVANLQGQGSDTIPVVDAQGESSES